LFADPVSAQPEGALNAGDAEHEDAFCVDAEAVYSDDGDCDEDAHVMDEDETVSEKFLAESKLNTVAGFSVITREGVGQFLKDNPDEAKKLPGSFDRSTSFTRAATKLGLTHAQREGMAAWARTVGVDEEELVHLDEKDVDLDEFILNVPLVRDANDKVVLSMPVVPLGRVYESYFNDPIIRGSLLSEVTASGFCSGAYFRQIVASGCLGTAFPLCLSLNCDKTAVVKVGTRSMWPVHVAILNSTLDILNTARVVAYLPILTGKDWNVSATALRQLRLLVFHAGLGAVCETGSLAPGCAPLMIDYAGDAPARVYPWIGLFVADSKDQDNVLAHRGGGKSAILCGRCGATTDSPAERAPTLDLSSQADVEAVLSTIALGRRGEKGPARQRLKERSKNMVYPFTWRLRHFDAALNMGTCRLHSGSLVLTKEVLLEVGIYLYNHTDEANRKERYRNNLDNEGPPPSEFLRTLNAELTKLVPGTKFFDICSGLLDLPKKTGTDCRLLVKMLPFALFGLLPRDSDWVLDYVLLWNEVHDLWRAATVHDVAQLRAKTQLFDPAMLRMAEATGKTEASLRQKPTVHALQHAATDVYLFGSSYASSTESYEKLHERITKKTFQTETSRTNVSERIAREMLRANLRRGLAFQPPRLAAPVSVAPVGVTGLGGASGQALIYALRPLLKNHLVSWEATTAINLIVRYVTRNGSLERCGDFFDARAAFSLKVRVGNGVRIPGGQKACVAPKSDGLIKSPVLELENGTFSVLLVAFELVVSTILPQCCFVLAKKLEAPLRDGLICPRFRLPLLRDGFSRNDESSYFLVDLPRVKAVWNAVVVEENEGLSMKTFYAVPWTWK